MSPENRLFGPHLIDDVVNCSPNPGEAIEISVSNDPVGAIEYDRWQDNVQLLIPIGRIFA